MAQVHKHAAAKRDLIEHFVYLVENAGLDTAERFMLQVEESFSDLGRHPSLGVQVELPRPEIGGIRIWHVKGFEKFLIFYRHDRRVCPLCASYTPPKTGGAC